MTTPKTILSSFGVAVLASFFVLLIGLCLFGFHLSEWTESQGRMIGLVGTFAGATGAAIALQILLRDHQVSDCGKNRGIETRRRL